MERASKIEFKLYLGRNITLADGSIEEVTDSDIGDFVKDVAGPVLKNLTVMNGLGVWEGEIEQSVIIVFIGNADKDEPGLLHHIANVDREKVRKVGSAYRDKFEQEMVYMTETRIMAEEI